MPARKSSRYTPPSPISARRAEILKNRRAGLGAYNEGTSKYAQQKLAAELERQQRVAAMPGAVMHSSTAAKQKAARKIDKVATRRAARKSAAARIENVKSPRLLGIKMSGFGSTSEMGAMAGRSRFKGLFRGSQNRPLGLKMDGFASTSGEVGGSEFGRYISGMPAQGTRMSGRMPVQSTAVSVGPRRPLQSTPVTMGPTRGRPAGARSTRRPIQIRRGQSGGRPGGSAVREALDNAPVSGAGPVNASVKKGMAKFLDDAAEMAKKIGTKRGLAIGAGVVGMGALLKGRERRGTSSGSQGMYRY